VFISTGCGSCHTLQEAGTDGAVGPNLDESLVLDAEAAGAQLADYVRTSIVDPDSVVMPQFSGGVMPTTYESQLSDEQLDDLVAFLVGAARSG
jgi:mono/diheme cytochrome c family protein